MTLKITLQCHQETVVSYKLYWTIKIGQNGPQLDKNKTERKN